MGATPRWLGRRRMYARNEGAKGEGEEGTVCAQERGCKGRGGSGPTAGGVRAEGEERGEEGAE